MTSEVKMCEAFAAKYQRDPDDPTSAEMLAVFSDGWEAARVEARAKALEEAAKACEQMHDEDRPGDYAWAVRSLAKEAP